MKIAAKLIGSLALGGLMSSCLAQDGRIAFRKARNFAYVLQTEGLGKREEALKCLAECERDVLIIDYSYDGSHEQRWTPDDIAMLRKNHTVLAYFSIGEAENYRYYWQEAWDRNKDGQPDEGAPAFLAGENPDWGGNYRVKYWHEEWQRIALGYLAFILQQGFDGVYLDIIDAFEGFEFDGQEWIDHRPNDETGRTYRQDMIEWVRRIATVGRKANPNFRIIPQNGVQLLEAEDYVKLIDGIGVESLFAEADKQRNEAERRERVTYLQALMKVGKPVLVTDYSTDKELQHWVTNQAAQYEYRLLFADRALNSMGKPAGTSN